MNDSHVTPEHVAILTEAGFTADDLRDVAGALSRIAVDLEAGHSGQFDDAIRSELGHEISDEKLDALWRFYEETWRARLLNAVENVRIKE